MKEKKKQLWQQSRSIAILVILAIMLCISAPINNTTVEAAGSTAVDSTLDKQKMDGLMHYLRVDNGLDDELDTLILGKIKDYPQFKGMGGTQLDDKGVILAFGDMPTKTVYILNVTDGKIYAPADSTNLFSGTYNEKLDEHTTRYISYYGWIKHLILDNFDTSKVTNMKAMFGGLGHIEDIDLSMLDTSNVTNMRSMFSGCINLKKLDLHTFNTDKVTDMGYMFQTCFALESLNQNGWDLTNVESMDYMYFMCRKLKTIDMSKFKVKKLKNMEGMFMFCDNLENVVFGDFDTSNVENMKNIFMDDYSIKTLDLSNMDSRNVTETNSMFRGCKSLKTIYASSKLVFKNKEENMFEKCEMLVGGKGTSYNENEKSSDYAVCDSLNHPGYFTCKTHEWSEWTITTPATITATGSKYRGCINCGDTETQTIPKIEIKPVTVKYKTHVQTFGWQDWKSNGQTSGTYGLAKRLEGINIKLEGNSNVGVIYTTHCQTYGWLPWSANGDMNGTEGEAKRLEAIEIKLTGADKDKYDIYYRVHAQSYGWLGWAKNGEPAGTAGYAKRLEGIQIVVKKRGEAAPSNTPPANEGVVYKDASNGGVAKEFYASKGNSPIVNYPATSNTKPVIPGENLSTVAYRTHVQSFGWQGWKFNGQMSGTSGLGKRLEAIEIKLLNKQYAGGIRYTTHVQSYGWQGDENNSSTWKKDGETAGTSGEAKRLEAIKIELYGEMANQYDVYYRVHAQSYGWLDWAKNGQSAGTEGLGKRLEGIEIRIVKKGEAAPGSTARPCVKNQ